MKTRLLTLAFAALCSLLFSSSAAAQGCQITAKYSNYNSQSVDSNDYIYQTVTTDGYAQMSATNYCHLNGVTHTPIVTNTLTEPNGTVHGGTYTGSSGCPSCYISEQNTLDILGVPGIEFTANSGGSVRCSVVGTFWGANNPTSFLSVHHTTYSFSYVSGGICTYRVFCPTSPHICGPDTVTAAPPCSSTYLITSWLKVRDWIYSTCFPGLARNSNTPEACD